MYFMSINVVAQVALPPALTGAPVSNDPRVRELHDELNEVSRKILNNELDIPPEGERSPSPEPVYDRNGIRLNTREVRVKDRLLDRRTEIIEELIKADPTYRPPPDYRPAKKQRKIFIPLKVGTFDMLWLKNRFSGLQVTIFNLSAWTMNKPLKAGFLFLCLYLPGWGLRGGWNAFSLLSWHAFSEFLYIAWQG